LRHDLMSFRGAPGWRSVPVGRWARFGVDDHGACDTLVAGRLSYSLAEWRCSIKGAVCALDHPPMGDRREAGLGVGALDLLDRAPEDRAVDHDVVLEPGVDVRAGHVRVCSTILLQQVSADGVVSNERRPGARSKPGRPSSRRIHGCVRSRPVKLTVGYVTDGAIRIQAG